MLVYLADYLTQYNSGFGVFQYLTLRAILGVLTALMISFMVGPVMIRRLTHHQIGQSVRDDGPQSHLSKAGTPTMGGALLLVGIAVSTLFWSDLGNRYVWVVLMVTLLFGVIGFIDDYKKLVLQNSKGLAAKHKYLWQSIVGLGAAYLLYTTASTPAETELMIPFFKHAVIDLGPGTSCLLTWSSSAAVMRSTLPMDSMAWRLCRRYWWLVPSASLPMWWGTRKLPVIC